MNDFTLLALWFTSGVIGCAIGQRRGRGLLGFILGFAGPLGWLAILLFRDHSPPRSRSVSSARYIPPEQVDSDPLGIYRKK